MSGSRPAPEAAPTVAGRQWCGRDAARVGCEGEEAAQMRGNAAPPTRDGARRRRGGWGSGQGRGEPGGAVVGVDERGAASGRRPAWLRPDWRTHFTTGSQCIRACVNAGKGPRRGSRCARSGVRRVACRTHARVGRQRPQSTPRHGAGLCN